MKRAIPFDLFGEKQELFFTGTKIGELEHALGSMIINIIRERNFGYEFCFAALPICLKNIQPGLYEEKIDNYILGAEGRTVLDIGILIGDAILAAGALGKKMSDTVMAKHYPELYKVPLEEENEKNV